VERHQPNAQTQRQDTEHQLACLHHYAVLLRV
jgi:hypothetical protein